MGGGDLNMKKSWHPLLMKNQERVWKEERKALEERKKTAQLQKELAEERQLQELQRLQAERGGGRREERVDWLYATPAIGNGVNAEEQEAYLLGKKTVDKLFKEKDEAVAKLQARAATQSNSDQPGGGFISIQNANTARDTASKILEDPLFLIKQQELLAYEALKKNPARLKASQSNLVSKSDRRKEKEEKKRLKKEIKEDRKRRHESSNDAGHGHNDSKRSRDERYGPRKSDPSASPDERYRTSRRISPRRTSPRRTSPRRTSPRRTSPRRTSPSFRHDHQRSHHRASPPESDREYHRSHRARSISPSRKYKDHSSSRSNYQESSNAHHPSSFQHHSRHDSSRHRHPESDRTHRQVESRHHAAVDSTHQQDSRMTKKPDRTIGNSQKLSHSKAAKLTEMQAAAKSLHESRSKRLIELESQDAAKLKIEQLEREKNRVKDGGIGDGIKAKFLIDQEKQVFFGQMDLAERVKRSGGVGLLKDKE